MYHESDCARSTKTPISYYHELNSPRGIKEIHHPEITPPVQMLALIRAVCGLNLSSLSSNASGKLDVFGHNGHSLGMDCAQVGVFEQTHQVSLASLL